MGLSYGYLICHTGHLFFQCWTCVSRNKYNPRNANYVYLENLLNKIYVHWKNNSYKISLNPDSFLSKTASFKNYPDSWLEWNLSLVKPLKWMKRGDELVNTSLKHWWGSVLQQLFFKRKFNNVNLFWFGMNHF